MYRCLKYYCVCVFISTGWLSWFGNSIVIFVLLKQRATLQPTDYLTLNLAISDASISVFGYSRGILEIFTVFQDNGYLITSVWTCQVHECVLYCKDHGGELGGISGETLYFPLKDGVI